MPQKSWSAKRERQYTHIKDSLLERGKGEQAAAEIAARTVNKERAQHGEVEQASASSINDMSASRRGGLRSHQGAGGRTLAQLRNEATQRAVKGRSEMNKAQLGVPRRNPRKFRLPSLCNLHTAERAVDGRPGDRKQFSQVADGMFAAVMHATQLFLLLDGKLRLLSPQFSFGTSNSHSLFSAHPDQIGFKLSEGGQDVEKHLAHRVGRIVDA